MKEKTQIPIEWKPIPEWPYEASSVGTIRNRKGFVLKPQPRIHGYHGYVISRATNGACERWTVSAHKLVTLAFLGPRPDGLEINHKNGIKTDNSPDNLEYVTPAQNREHATRMGLYATGEQISACMPYEKVRRGTTVYGVRLNDAKVREIRQLYDDGFTQMEISAMFGVTQPTISDLVRGMIWKHVT